MLIKMITRFGVLKSFCLVPLPWEHHMSKQPWTRERRGEYGIGLHCNLTVVHPLTKSWRWVYNTRRTTLKDPLSTLPVLGFRVPWQQECRRLLSPLAKPISSSFYSVFGVAAFLTPISQAKGMVADDTRVPELGLSAIVLQRIKDNCDKVVSHKVRSHLTEVINWRDGGWNLDRWLTGGNICVTMCKPLIQLPYPSPL